MIKKNLHELIAMCEEECAAITKVNVGSVNSFSTPLITIMQRELMTFAVYITMSGGISDDEYRIIKAYLNFNNLPDAKLRQEINLLRPSPAFDNSKRPYPSAGSTDTSGCLQDSWSGLYCSSQRRCGYGVKTSGSLHRYA